MYVIKPVHTQCNIGKVSLVGGLTPAEDRLWHS